jgi:hypothetical protein
MYRKSLVSSAVIMPNAITVLVAPDPSAGLVDAALQSPNFSYPCGLADLSLYTTAETRASLLPRFSRTKSVHFNTDGGFLCS